MRHAESVTLLRSDKRLLAAPFKFIAPTKVCVLPFAKVSVAELATFFVRLLKVDDPKML
ncbi:MAG: hypothetical protein UW24_C0018G0002 [Parcubacteria group bacterium GW2011_GWA2_44_12]|nr:MAG: hypothetical protein UW24_C0018G0002 [Parcubacteria group bacterium GW2011_GWA2_44_12]